MQMNQVESCRIPDPPRPHAVESPAERRVGCLQKRRDGGMEKKKNACCFHPAWAVSQTSRWYDLLLTCAPPSSRAGKRAAGAVSAAPVSRPRPLDDGCQIRGWMLGGRKEMLTGGRVAARWKKEKKYFFLKKKGKSEELCVVFRTWGNALTPSVCLCFWTPPLTSPAGSVSLGVFLVSVAFVVCAVWLVALCGVCTWCQRKLVRRRGFHFLWNAPFVSMWDTFTFTIRTETFKDLALLDLQKSDYAQTFSHFVNISVFSVFVPTKLPSRRPGNSCIATSTGCFCLPPLK